MDIKVQGSTVSLPPDCDAIIEDKINGIIHIVKKGEHKKFSRSSILSSLRTSVSAEDVKLLETSLQGIGALK